MSKQDIYSTGGTVQAANGLYISRRADSELLRLTRAGDFAYVLSTRQVGKSSLMIHTAEQLHREGVRNVIIDLGQIGVGVTREEWYLGLLAKIERGLELKTTAPQWFEEHSQLGMIQRMTTFFEEVVLRETNDRVVIFVDEIDTTLSLDFTDDFFAAIRYFYNARAHIPELKRISFVLIGAAAPGDLIRDPVRTPFNIGQQVDLTDFTFEEALPLASGFGLDEEKARTVLRWILKWTKGHPYLTQRICKRLAAERRVSWNEDEVDDFVSTIFLRSGTADANLAYVRDMLTKRAPDVTTVLTTYQRIRAGRESVYDEVQSIPKNHLKLSGIVCREKLGEKAVLQLRNPIYRDVFTERWTRDHLPVNWVKRARQVGLFAIVAMFIISLGVLVPFSWWTNKKREQADEQRKQAELDLRNLSSILEAKNYEEEQKHFRPPLESPEKTEVLFNTPERGSLELKLYHSDNCILVERTPPGPHSVKIRTWLTAVPRDTQPPPEIQPRLEISVVKEPKHFQELHSVQLAAFMPLALPAITTFGRCLNPHPYSYTTSYGGRSGCWLAVYRTWRDGCQHYQWLNTCYGSWDPTIHWTSCVH